ncbi:uncharacterized protein LOC143198550 [Rhynchophorus ferrugineus]|uniref:uncharacterized protein LOC143198550 n=1 Tax=Rhynchophorus ferrugineus TaxID=354439 RepID=UPI003FCCADEC
MLVSMRSVVLAILVVIFCISQIGGEDIEKQPASKTIAETDVFINNASEYFTIKNENSSVSQLTKTYSYYGSPNFGYIRAGDYLRADQFAYANRSPGYVIYQRYFIIGRTIHAIRVTNYYSDGFYSTAAIFSGGVGYTYVVVRLTSQYHRGFYYRIQIYA